jgi:hypothetical protein
MTAEKPDDRSSPPPMRIRLTLEAMPDDVPADNRLRRLLKMMKRAYGFRMVMIEDAPEKKSC